MTRFGAIRLVMSRFGIPGGVLRNTRRGALIGLVVGVVAGCANRQGAESVVLHEPPTTDFDAVVGTLSMHCGSLDCHGQTTRNLKLYGQWGMRLDPANVPGSSVASTPGEVEADYWSVVGLEPEIAATVFSEHGTNPGRLTLIRKALGLEKHKGGAVFSQTSDGYACLKSFYAGAVDAAACSNSEMKDP